MASNSLDYQKWIVALIDVHLEKLGQTENRAISNVELERFDIEEYLIL